MITLTHRARFLALAVLALTLLAACQPQAAGSPDDAALPGAAQDAGTRGPVQTPAPVTTPEAAPDEGASLPEEEPLPAAGYWLGPGVPASLSEALVPTFEQAGLQPAGGPDGALIGVQVNPPAETALTAQWVYAIAAPFPTVADDVAWQAVQQYWLAGDASGLVGFETPPSLVLSPDVVDWLTAEIGPPAAGLALQTGAPAELEALAWDARPSLSILPFEALTPRWKVLRLDGQSVLDKALDAAAYPLTRTVGLSAAGDQGQQIAAALQSGGVWPATNRDPARMTVVTMTGVTALVRATAMMMESRGITYPADAILPFFADADILHTSNEVSFSASCPPPDWVGPPQDFCSAPRYFELLTHIGLDVVELTGNHLNDIGTQALAGSLGMYNDSGIVYYGGGANLEDARTPRIVNAPDGTRIAFVGCNDPGPAGAFATAETPGAAPCDDWVWITDAIAALKAQDQADFVIATVQYWEVPGYAPTAEHVEDFARLATAGADIVAGSHAHQPQSFAFQDGTFIHYGMGNLFFDQMDFIENRQMFADKHILYEGRHISTVLFTGLMEEYAQPNPMTPEDRAAFLAMMFAESGW
jgi:poly-gamma-glutamate synthesis protein (capsule biosynthesis protein)